MGAEMSLPPYLQRSSSSTTTTDHAFAANPHSSFLRNTQSTLSHASIRILNTMTSSSALSHEAILRTALREHAQTRRFSLRTTVFPCRSTPDHTPASPSTSQSRNLPIYQVSMRSSRPLRRSRP